MSDQRGERDSDVDASPEPGDTASTGAGAAADDAEGAAARPAGKRSRASGSAPVSPARGASTGKGKAAAGTKPTAAKSEKPRENVLKRIIRFLREVVAELRKVIWPNRKQTVTYTIVVFIFLAFMVGLIFGLDQLFARGVLWLLG